jgi:catechol 2,3-dioxygenase-like lactoylglutathione lyase family enzyme
MALKINKIGVVSVPVRDQDAAKKFYVDVLGFECVTDQAMGPDQRWVQLRPANAQTSISLVTWFDQMKPGGVRGLVLETGDIAAAHADLKARGVNVDDPDVQPWGTFVSFEDIDANGIILMQPPAA